MQNNLNIERMNTKRWIALAIVAVVVVGSLGLIKLFPFWVTLACLVSLVGGFAAGYLTKNPIEEVAELVDPSEVVDKIKDWFTSLTSNEASKAVAAAKKIKAKTE